ncbi:uncharacterized protein LOC123311161 [Coccinella septempunctata]|uniref:uncharacterized protein LOC123311161 n=1 Tax=Coccinella septempunctata TaxID=41139 RepID=UPI001D06CA1E|nr:uncharacterized protein LOC123311161 [Coccinella septempunctata]
MLNMKPLSLFCVFCVFKICYAEDKKCNPRFHYFQPFYGKIPPKAFKAGVDKNGEDKYIARIVSLDERTWSAPTTFSASSMWTFFGWQGETDKKVTKFIELMMVEPERPGFGWFNVKSKRILYNLYEDCCFVEGGYGFKDGKKYTAYVARTNDKGVYHVGGLYMPDWTNKESMHYMDGWESKYIETGYDVLAYDCCQEVLCNPRNKNHPSNCCTK